MFEVQSLLFILNCLCPFSPSWWCFCHSDPLKVFRGCPAIVGLFLWTKTTPTNLFQIRLYLYLRLLLTESQKGNTFKVLRSPRQCGAEPFFEVLMKDFSVPLPASSLDHIFLRGPWICSLPRSPVLNFSILSI